jgi:hypothetical protein
MLSTFFTHSSATLNLPGRQVATLLAGSWRQSPPPLEFPSSTLDFITPLLLSSGAGALAWWRLRNALNPPNTLREIYLQYAVRAAEHERQIIETLKTLRAVGIDPILIKGWAVGRSYAEPGLRPCGDIDLFIHPKQQAQAHAALGADENCKHYWIDLDHLEARRYNYRFEELYERSEVVNLENCSIRILGAEDQLRFLCLHFLKHGGSRPLWLCDVSAALEANKSDFDWNLCLGKVEPWAHWVTCTLILAKTLLQADLEDAPIHEDRIDLPPWLVVSVLKQWSHPYPANLPLFVKQIKNIGWRKTISTLPQRWPNPIQASVDTNACFSRGSRLPVQLKNCSERLLKLRHGSLTD